MDLESVLSGIFDIVLSSKDCVPELSSCQDRVNVFLDAATFSKDVEKESGKGMSIEDLINWFAFVPSVRKFLGSLLILPNLGFVLLNLSVFTPMPFCCVFSFPFVTCIVFL